jgi:thioredoxin-like negative regulator of GroEL
LRAFNFKARGQGTQGMDTRIFTKTASGLDEVKNRTRGLSGVARRLLIMADGRQSLQALAGLFREADDIVAMASQLASQGLIQLVSGEAAGAAPKAQPAIAAPTRLPLAQASRQAARIVIDALGPIGGESYALKLEKAKTPDEFNAALRQAVQTLKMDRRTEASTALEQLAYTPA